MKIYEGVSREGGGSIETRGRGEKSGDVKTGREREGERGRQRRSAN